MKRVPLKNPIYFSSTIGNNKVNIGDDHVCHVSRLHLCFSSLLFLDEVLAKLLSAIS